MNSGRQRSRTTELRRWMLVIVAVGAVTLACSGVAAWLRERESAREREFYGGRSVREWVELAIAVRTPEPTSEAARMISRIGAPAVPPLVDSLDRLRESRVHAQLVVWQTQYLPARCQWLEARPDVSGDVTAVTRLLTGLAEAARPAVPAMVRSMDQVHYWARLEILDDLAELGPVADEAVPWLRTQANKGDVDAAWALSFIVPGDDTLERVLIRTIQVTRTPSAADRELYWLRDDTELNRRIVPLLAQLLADPTTPEDERKHAAVQLGYRGNEARTALPLMRAAAEQTESTALRKEISDAIQSVLKASVSPPGSFRCATGSVQNIANYLPNFGSFVDRFGRKTEYQQSPDILSANPRTPHP